MPSNLYLESQSLAFTFQSTQDPKPVPGMALIAVLKYLVPNFGGGLEMFCSTIFYENLSM